MLMLYFHYRLCLFILIHPKFSLFNLVSLILKSSRFIQIIHQQGVVSYLFCSCCFLLSENDRPTSLVPDLIDYNMPLTATYLKQMKLQCMTATERVSVMAK